VRTNVEPELMPVSKWSLKEWTSVAEMIGAAAVVLSLAYVAVELRSNTRAVEAATLLEVNRIAREHLLVGWTDADATRIEMTGDQDPANLSPLDQQRYFWSVRSFWLGMQTVYRQYALGVLPAEEWQVYYGVICSNIAAPGKRSLWTGGDFVPDFVTVVEACPSFKP
jgi:hypothetical protein